MERYGKIRKLLLYVCCFLMLISVVGFSACETEGAVSPGESVRIELSSNRLTLNLWEETVLTASASGNVQWTVDDNTVISLEDNGAKCIIKALKEGTATVTASAGDAVTSCRITVNGSNEVPSLSFEGIDFGTENIGDLRLMKGDSFTLNPILTYGTEKAEDFAVQYSDEDKGVISISDDGKITALETGTEKITAVAQWNGYDVYSMRKEIVVEVVSDAYLLIEEYDPIVCKYNPFQTSASNEAIKAPAVRLLGSEATDVSVEWKEVALTGDTEGVAVYDSNTDSFVAGDMLKEGKTHFKAVYTAPSGEVAESERIEVSVCSVKGSVAVENANVMLGIGELRNLQQVKDSAANDISKGRMGTVEVKNPEGEVVESPRIDGYISSNEKLAVVSPEGEITAQNGSIDAVATSEECTISAIVYGAAYPVATVRVTNFDGFYSVANVSDWNALPDGNSSDNFVLTDDIDFGGTEVTKKFGRVNYNDADGLSGIFDGNGHTIKNYVAPGGASQALIGQVAADGLVRNVSFTGVVGNTTVGDYYGCVIGFLLGRAEDIYAEITIPVGREYASVDATKCVGGLVGQGRSTRWNLRRCIVKILVDTPDDLPHTGALVGAITHTNAHSRIIDGYVISSVDIPPVSANATAYAPESLNENETDSSNGKYAKYEDLAALKEKQLHLFAEGGIFNNTVWNVLLNSATDN